MEKLTDAEAALKAAQEAEDQLNSNRADFEAYKYSQKNVVDSKAQDGDSDACKQLISDAKAAIDVLVYDENKNLDQNKAAVDAILEQLDKDLPAQREADKKTSSGGYYVATCVYGSYDCPEVWTLRRFRDRELAKSWYGRAFIRTYYAISPTVVKLVGDTDWFQSFWRARLDKMVSKTGLQYVKHRLQQDFSDRASTIQLRGEGSAGTRQRLF